MGGVFETHRTAAAVFKGTPGNSCVWSISDYASFQVFGTTVAITLTY